MPNESIMPGDPVIIEPYNPEWPRIFTELQNVIGPRVKNLALAIEHIGSTSVPHLAAKPIIDLDIVIPFRAFLPRIIEALQPLGYVHNGDQGIPGREAFKRLDEYVPHCQPRRRWLRHHLYVCDINAEQLRRQIYFRDYLRTHPLSREEYAKLKRRLASDFGEDRERYTEAKSDFILNILKTMPSDYCLRISALNS